MKNIENPMYKSEISTDFIHQIEYVRTRIFEKCEPKRGYGAGSLVNGMSKFKIIINIIKSLYTCFITNNY